MIENMSLLAHSAIKIKIKDGRNIYFDPFKLDDNIEKDADYIFITHPHYDHFSPEDIEKIRKAETKIIVPEEIKEKVKELHFEPNNVLAVNPNEYARVDDIHFYTVPAYNINKEFHKKEYNWVGYVISLDAKDIYVAGDTDCTEEAKKVRCDIAFVPVGGTYTMNAKEAVLLIKEIRPKIAIPIHYGSIVGNIQDAYLFRELLENIVNVEILKKSSI